MKKRLNWYGPLYVLFLISFFFFSGWVLEKGWKVAIALCGLGWIAILGINGPKWFIKKEDE